VRRVETIPNSDLRRAGVPLAGFPELPGVFEVAGGTESLRIDIANIKALSVETWMGVHQATIRYAEGQGWEKGRKARIDSTVVETDIHLPTDSTLLQDGIRVITRWLADGHEFSPRPE
jgi:hypothetical protein